ncbi:MAG: hypothetical protein IRZ10_10815 [Thermoflavifilum sp.]|nr:hypothetical protein [Thermoflavifilum sp.]MCL6514898.1 hypothetical protein [Alicyclobacillus sp.]
MQRVKAFLASYHPWRSVATLIFAMAAALSIMPAPTPKAFSLIPGRVPFTLHAARIDATNAVINLSGELSFQSAVIQGLTITYSANGHTYTINVPGTVQMGSTQLYTSFFQTLGNDLSALGDIQKPDIGTVLLDALAVRPIPELVITNLTLKVDEGMNAAFVNMPGMQLSVS